MYTLRYVPRERPTFSALNFRSGAYHFHKFPPNPFRSITILHFLADFAVPETIIFKTFFNFSPAPRVSTASQKRQPDASWQFRRQAISRSKRIKLVPEPFIFKLKTAQARSGAPYFHARPGARSGARAHFSAAHTYQIWGEYPPPPPRNLSLTSNAASFQVAPIN